MEGETALLTFKGIGEFKNETIGAGIGGNISRVFK